MSDLPSLQAPRPAEASRKRLLQKLLRGQGLIADGIPRADRGEPLPLSFAQQRLWFLDRLHPGSSLYNIPLMLDLEGPADPEAIRASLLQLTQRHEALRSVIAAGDDAAVQIVHAEARLPWTTHDLSGRPDAAQAARALAEEIALEPFDLETGPLLRAAFVRYGEQHAILVLALHHIIADGWSLGVLMREFAMLYGERIGEIPASARAEPALQYPDYAAWQRRRLDEATVAPSLEYWTRHLSPLPEELSIPADPAAIADSGCGGRIALTLEGPRLHALRELAHRERRTLFVALLGVWTALLHRVSGQTDLVVGTPVAGRDRADVTDCVGLFVNTLALRCAVDGTISFAGLLARLHEVTQEGLAHAELPFERLVQALAPDRASGRSPLFQVAFDYVNTDLQDIALPGLRLRPLDLQRPPAKFDLTLVVGEYPGGISAGIEYDASRFGEARMRALAHAFERMVEAVVARPEAPLGDLPLMSPAEQRKVLHEWNDDRSPPLPEETLVGLIRAQAARTPDAPAIEAPDLCLSYAELERRANRLAHRLRVHGVVAGTMVGVCLPRSAEAIVAFLAVMKTGAAYVPLDPAFPAGRLALMCEDARPALVLTIGRLREVLPPLEAAVVCLDETGDGMSGDGVHEDGVLDDSALDDGRSDGDLPQGPLPDTAAYVVYTSGSTGRPKGVVATHRGCVRLTREPNYVSLAPNSRVLHLSTTTFDAATFEIWSPLVCGGCVVVAPPENLSPAELSAFAEQQRVSAMFLTTALFNHVADTAPALFEHVPQVLFGGEAVSAAHVSRALRHAAPGGLIHVYGPTETTTFATFQPLNGIEGGIPIGRPIGHTRCYVLDARLQPVPPGVPGELYIGGAGLARGYLHRGALTAERFLPDPFDGPGARMYRSGDIVCQRADGAIDFVGRADHQVKIRGFRIELGEIEAALRELPEVADVRVLCREDMPGERRLAAYVVPRDPDTQVAALREALRQSLPEFMVPALWTTLPAFPLTPTGKVDWRALPAIDGDAMGESAHEAPRNETERQLADIWQQVLGVGRVGIRDNFFDIGGHSLAAMQVATRIAQVFGIDLPLRAQFDSESLAELALAVDRQRDSGVTFDYQSITPVTAEGEHPLSHAQKRLWFLAQMEPDNPFYNIPWAIELEGRLDPVAFELALQAMVDRHDALRTVFATHGGQPGQRVIAQMAIEVPLIDLSDQSEDSAREQALELARSEARESFDLEHGPLLRCCIVRFPAGHDLLLLTVHHIVCDGWSMGVLVEEIGRVYAAGRRDALPPATLQYVDYTQWQNRLLDGEHLHAQEGFWMQRLGGPLPALELPTDRPRPAVQSYRGSTRRYELDPARTQAVRQLARRSNASLFMAMLAAFKLLLCKLSGERDILVGTPIAGRRDPALEKMVGFFVNTLVLRTDLGGDPSFSGLLERVRDTAFGAWAHQDYPFDQLVETLNPPRDLGRQPIFTVLFTVQNEIETLTRNANFAGLNAALFGGTTTFSKFDLSMFVSESADSLSVHLEYATDLFDADRIDRIFAQYVRVLDAVTAVPSLRISQIGLQSADELDRLLRGFNPPVESLPAVDGAHRLFEAQVRRAPECVALVDGDTVLSYAELDARANRLANHLRELGVGAEDVVALMLDRSPDAVIAMLAVLKAGGCYLPLDPAYPRARLRLMATESGAGVLLCQAAHIKAANRLLWDAPCLHHLVALDADDATAIMERGQQQIDRKLWDYVAERATNAINASGWMSSYTGEDLSAEEMDEYVTNVLAKLRPHLTPQTRILEVGCGSGLSMFALAPHVAHYHGTDLSPAIIERTRAEAEKRGLHNISVQPLPGERIGEVEGEFDIVVLNSVIQLFPGHNVLRDVLRTCAAKMRRGGVIFVGDVMDLRRRDALLKSLADFRREHAGSGYRTKLDWDDELFVDPDFFHDLRGRIPGVAGARISDKIGTIANELTGFRYDALIDIVPQDGPAAAESAAAHVPAKRYGGRSDIASASVSAPAVAGDLDRSAYVMYTSGSTGLPKGVVVTHRGIVRLAHEPKFVNIAPEDTLLQLAPLGFDASTLEVWAALANGAKLALAPADTRSPQEIGELLRYHKVSVLWLTAALFQQMVEHRLEDLAGVRQLLAGGEALPVRQVKRFVEAYPGNRLINGYGPTENTTFSTTHHIAAVGEHATGVPIGRPIGHSTAYILDRDGQPVPVGVAGELYVGGAGLARGYLRRPGLTAERFVPNAWATQPGERLYRTGDLARHAESGEIEYLGRIDQQVKIRGHRIEPGEIDVVLGEHPQVRQALATVLQNANGDRQIVAYIAAEAALSIDALRQWLRGRLPEYMVPARFVVMDALPLNVNGKIDRKALPDPDAVPSLAAAGQGPRDEIERLITDIWQGVLGREGIGIRDNFFDLGGHSLLATQVISRISEAIGVEVPIRTLFTDSTIASFALALREIAGRGLERTAIARLPEQTHYPLSHAQRRMWFLAQFDPHGSSYNMVVTLALDGDLRVDVLRASLDAMVRRHEALRTVFESVRGEPMQRILPEAVWPFEFERVAAADDDSRRRLLLEKARAVASQPFDLERESPCRAQMLSFDSGESVLVLVLHHIVSDGWSMDLLADELAVTYRALLQGTDPVLQTPSVRYVDVAAWQNARVDRGELKAQEDFWLRALQDLPPPLDLPADRPRPSRRSDRGATITRAVPQNTAAAIRALAKTQNATLYATMLAGFQVLLWRLGGTPDVVLGTPVANRHHLDIEGVVGFFVNTLVLRGKPSPGRSFDEWLRQVQSDVLRAIANQDYPFDLLVEQLQPERDLSRTPLFQVMFALRNQGLEPPVVDLGGVRARGLPLLENEQARFDLTATARDGGDTLHVEFEYCADLFDEATVEGWLDLYLQILAQASAAPQRTLAALTAPADIEAWRAQSQGPAAPPLTQTTLDAAWVAQARATPERPALSDGRTVLSYAEALRRSSAIAHGLRASGAGRGDFVAVAGARSIDTVLTYLGVLQAGASFVYLDPALPAARMRQMLQDTAAVHVVSTGACALPVDAPRTSPLAQIEALGAGMDGVPTHALAEGVAHVIYTSGSTGRPKGVLVGHRNVLRLAAQTRELQVLPQHRMLQAATLSFDASTFEIWNALLHGAELVVAADEAVGDPERLAEFIARERIDVAWLTSSLFNAIVDLDPGRLSGLRRLLAGGEALSVPHIARALQTMGPDRLVNGYGPTENTTFSTTYAIDTLTPGRASIPIGRPLQDSSARVLDAFGQPVPAGVPGELYVGGDGVSFGYLGQPALTAERFVPDPWSARPGGRLYRTGDRVRQRRDGAIEYLGRTDTQLKIRGFRIEPGEIEAVLAQHPQVGAAAVIAPRGADGMPRLVAYVSAAENGRVGLPAALRAYLRERLPEYMVPARIVALDVLPLTRNGKLDVAALPTASDETTDAAARPSTPLQQVLAAIWSDVLGVDTDTLGLHDNFFERGGHSLLAAQVMSRLRTELAAELPLRVLFEAPTIAELATQLEPALAQGAAAVTSPIVAQHGDGPTPLSLFQQRFWFLHQTGQSYRASLALQLRGDLDVPAFERALAEVLRRHEVLRSCFPDEDGRPMQRVLPLEQALPLPLALTDLSSLPPAQVDTALQGLLDEEALRPLDLARGPVLRASLVRIAADRHMLMLTMHHIVYDAWSLGILMRELDAGYRAAHQGLPSPLAPLPVQYADFAAWQHQRLQGESLQQLLSWWYDKLHDVPQVLNLPTDRPRGLAQTQQGETLECPLSDDLAAGLHALARRNGSTLFMTMLAAFDALLHRVCRQDDLCVGTLAANRSRIEVEPLIGMFVNVLVLRSRFERGESFETLLRRTRREVLEGFAHQDLPFETLLEQPFVQRSSGQPPLFQAMFVLENDGLMGLGGASSDGLEFVPTAADAQHARCDLTLNVRERGGSLCSYFEYDMRLFDRASIERLMAQWQTLLHAIVADPRAAIDELPLLGEVEQQQLRRFSPAYETHPVAGTLHERFVQAALANPQAVAVWDQGRELTYADLHVQSDRLARRLRAHGVGPEVPVALCLERNAEMVVAVLGVLKAGGAYVPLDPAYPSERLAYTVEDSSPAVVLAHAALRERLESLTAVPVLELESLLAEPAPESSMPLPAAMPSEHAAYVIYTSGSTGKPKGVTVTHGNVLRLFDATRAGFEFDHRDVWTLFHSYAFDFSVWEIWGPLLHGGRLVVVPYLLSRSPEAFRRLLIEQQVTVLNQTPSAFQQLVAADAQANDDGAGALALRYVVFGGEALNVGSLTPWFRRHGHRRPLLVNMYGITETTVHVTYEALHEHGASRGTIGRAIDDLRCYVLDTHQRPVPIGVPGELCVAGAGLARGYLRRPGLTASRFVPDPFSQQPGQRMYRSGDLARWRPDGSLEYLGRIDQQVKIRGFRIELGEIEAALLAHPQVSEAAVVVQPDAAGGRLVAYVANPDEASADDVSVGDASPQQQLQQWQSVFEHTYGDDAVPASAGETGDSGDFNIVGWTRRLDGQQIPPEQMRQWLDGTMRRLRALRPRRVLELGSGTGMLLLRLAPECERFVGTDFSPASLAYVRRQLDARSHPLPGVSLLQRAAHEIDDLADDFDLVILNSVAQYFPSADYFEQVVRAALRRLSPGGSLFLGDLRSLPLLPAFAAGLALQRATATAPASALRHAAHSEAALDGELLLDPAALSQRLRAWAEADGLSLGLLQAMPREGEAHNELSGYRFDLVVQRAPAERVSPAAVAWQDWSAEDWNPARLQQRLEALAAPDATERVLALRGLPNARTARDALAAQWLQQPPSAQWRTAAELQTLLRQALPVAVDPHALLESAQALGLQVELSWIDGAGDGGFRALFATPDQSLAALRAALHAPPGDASSRPWASHPQQALLRRRLPVLLREHLQHHLPEYMLPAAYVWMPRLPLTGNGKLDRQALPPPPAERTDLADRYLPPQTDAQRRMAGIWAEVLGLSRIGIQDNFFELGGHSLLATQVAARVQKAFGRELPLRALFEQPTIEALCQRLEASLNDTAAPPPLLPAPRDGDELPMSFAQQRLWFLDRLNPGGSVYNIALAMRVRGRLDQAALQRTLDEIVRRHEVLRTCFGERDSQPVQRVLPAAPAELRVRALAPEQARHAVEAFAQEPFDLARGPLLRVLLAQTGEDEALLAFAMHHIVGDGWSIGVLVKEMVAAYPAFCAGREPVLPPLPVQYADFAVWQRRWLEGPELQRQLGYWREQLQAPLPVLDLPADFPRPPRPSHHGGHVPVAFDAGTVAALRELAQREGCTPYMVLFAAFAVLLARHSGQDDLIIGTPVANRRQAEIEPLVGFFVNTLPVRVGLGGRPRFRELLRRAKEASLGAQAHQDLPFERLVEEVQPVRDPARSPLFQAGFDYINTAQQALELPGVTLSALETDHPTAKFDLSLLVGEHAEGLAAELEYSADLFRRDTAERMARRLERLLHAALRDPDARIDALSLLSDEERAQSLLDWNDAPEAAPLPGVVARFETCAAQTPEHPALRFGETVLGYGELNARANRLAHALIALGVRREDRVALCLERSIELPVSMLAVLKAGAAYMPLDPAYPAERVAYMLGDARPRVVLAKRAQASLPDRLPAGTQLLLLDETDFDDLSAENPAQPVVPQDLAYVIYTSGSTGRPKGTLLTHGGLANLAQAQQRLFGIGSQDRVLQFASINFDASTWETAMALANGATLCLATADDLRPGAPLTQTLRVHGVTVATLPPVAVNLLSPDDLPGLRTLIVAGEACPPGMAQRWSQGGRAFFNAYGPTETTVCASAYRCRGDEPVSPPIGRAIGGMRLYVVDAAFAPQPVGVPGELCVAGAGLARGYAGRAALTAERFVPEPFSGESGARMYRTGDLVRWTADGQLEFLGRIDHQVKIRGVRIELGEVEAALCAQPGVREAIVLAREDQPGDKRLVAYYTVHTAAEGTADGDPSSGPDAQSLRQALKRSLPESMLPARILRMEAMPLTPSGKIDRKALPAPEQTENPAESERTAPRDETERLLADIWQQVLSVPQVGIEDNFFDLGGHSLSAMHMATRVAQVFGVELPLRDVFDAQTLAELARVVGRLRDSTAPVDYQRIERVSESELHPLSHAQMRLWFLTQMEPDNPFYNIPWAIELEGRVDTEALREALQAMIDRHAALRTGFLAPAGQAMQRVWPRTLLDLPVVDLASWDAAAAREHATVLAYREAKAAFDLERGPLLRCTVVRLPDGHDVVLLTLHHIVSDGWSMGILMSEIGQAYEARGADGLEPLPLQYIDYAQWQNRLLTGERRQRQEDFWLAQLDGELPLLELPADRPRPAVLSYRGETRRYLLDAELSARLRALARGHNASLFMTLLAGFKSLLYKLTGEHDLLVGTPIAGRRDPALEKLVGFFVNTLVLRTNLGGDPTFAELLGRVRDTAFGAWAHQDYPFDQLVEVLNPPRDMGRQPIFTVLFTVQNEIEALGRDARFGGLRATPFTDTTTFSKFDLSMYVAEAEHGLSVQIEYSTDLFDPERIDRFFAQYARLLAFAAGDPAARLSEIDLMTDDERRRVLTGFNPEAGLPLPAFDGVHRLFEAQVARAPERIALLEGDVALSRGELDAQANRLAHQLQACGIGVEDVVALMLDRSPLAIVAMLAVLKVGACYLPLDPAYPPARLRLMAEDCRAKALITQSAHIRQANRLLWNAPTLDHLLTLDADEPTALIEQGEAVLDLQLWDFVAERATNAINASGWMSSYTGEDLSAEEMDEYVANVVTKLNPHLKPETRVLEVGCGSGLTMFAIAPRVAHYHGTDLSPAIIERDRAEAERLGLGNVSLQALPADRVGEVEGEFDVIVLNSVIQLFPGHNYLREVLRTCAAKLSANGVIFVGDVMDLRRRDALLKSLADFKREHAGSGYRTKLDWDDELFVDHDFFHDLRAQIDGVAEVRTSDKIGIHRNELTGFRYDALIHFDKRAAAPAHRLRKRFVGRAEIAARSDRAPQAALCLDQAAYVMYTSGSTGTPKGAVITHRGILRLVHAPGFVDIAESDTLLQLAPLGFDASTLEIWAALSNGAPLAIAPPGTRGLDEIGALLVRHRISVLWLTAALFQQMVEHQLADLAGVRQLLAGGDALPVKQVRRFIEAYPQNRLINGYGPTENTTFSTTHPLSRVDENATSVPIGRPIRHSSVYILDRDGRPLPIGVAGELHVGGDGLARGYLRRPGLTAERFVPNMFATRPGERLYRTGDLARFNADGEVEYLGRIDRQVKIRGHRIELGEIEAALLQHPDVREAAVLARPMEQGERQVVAYVAGPQQLSADAMRAFLKERLPEYMLPARLVLLERMPVTRNGKLDRQALPAPDSARPDLDTDFAAPSNEAERILAEIWQELLGVARVGVHDNFFDLGGDSILSLQIVARLNQQGFQASPRLLFQHQTIAELALHLDRAEAGETRQAVSGPVALTPIQSWFFEHDFAKPQHWNHALMLASRARLDAEALRTALQALLDHHDALRMGFARGEDGLWQQHNRGLGEAVAMEEADLSDQTDPLHALALRTEALHQGIGLADGPLLRAGLFHLGEAGDRLLLVVHHLAVDGVSWRILLEDLGKAYAQACAGRAPELPPRTSSFQAWAAALREHARSDELNGERAYWRTLAARDDRAALCPRGKSPDDTVANSGQVRTRLPAALSAQLLGEARQAYRTEVNDLLLAGTMRALRRWRGIAALTVDLEGHGRETEATALNRLDISRTVGWFTSLFPVALALADGDDIGADIRSVKECLRAVPGKGIGWGVLRYLAADPVIASAPSSAMSFNYLGQFNAAATDTDLGPARESSGELIAASNRRTHPLTVNAMVSDGELVFDISYGRAHFADPEMAALAVALREEMEALTAHCMDPENGGVTASDFDLLGISQDQLDNIFD